MKKTDDIEKAKWQIGEVRVDGKGVAHECYGYDDNGKAQIRRVKKSTAISAKPTPDTSKKTTAATPAASTTSVPKPKTEDKKPAPYDAPTPKVTYNKRPAKEVEIQVRVPATFKYRGADGKIKDAKRETYRKAYANMKEEGLLKFLNNRNNSPEMRMMAWEEAQARGIDESKIDVSGSLQRRWDKAKQEYDFLHQSDKVEDEETYLSFNTTILDTFDWEKFQKEFPDGDKGWMNKKDERIQKQFNGLKTKLDRQQYDAFKDIMKRNERYYEPWQEVLQDLGRDFLMFTNDDTNSVFVSTGGAGAGKTSTLKKAFSLRDLKPLEPGDNPEDADYDYVMLSADVDNDKEFSDVLHKYNGKIIVFDDKDKLLTSRSNKLINMMKAIGDSDKKQRKFKNPEGKDEYFTGKLIFISNKSKETLNRNEDMRAVMSRAITNDIDYTVNETLEVLANRYMTMEPDAMADVKADDPELEKEYRQKAFDIIMDMSDKLDPMTFTVRKFKSIMTKLNNNYLVEKMNGINEDFGHVIGKPKDFERIVVTELEKSMGNEDTYFEKAVFKKEVDALTDEQKEIYKKLYKKDPKTFVELFGKQIIDIINGKAKPTDQTEDEVKKAFENQLGGMTLDEAENLLFK